MLQLESASAHYNGQIVLTDISMQVPAGQKLALVGHSGSGKSTLLKLLYQQRPRDIALVPQDYGLVLTLSVFHNVYMGRLNRHPLWYNLLNLIKPRTKPLEEVSAVLEQVALKDKIFEPAGQLSGGQQQRCAIARALYQHDEILLADEPVSSLDEQQSKTILSLLCQQFGTVVLAMHDIDLALTYCDRIIGLQQGHICIDQPAASLCHDDLTALYGD